jgi:site-specific recombinase XerD
MENAQRANRAPATQMYGIDEWVAWNRRRGLSAVSTSTFWRSLRPFMKYLVRQDGIQNPFDGTRMPPIPKLLPKAKRPSECRHILDSARNYPWRTPFQRARAVAIFGLLIYAGLRRNEVTSLRFLDVNLDAGTVLVQKGKGRFGGKDRVAYMNDALRLILREYIRERQQRGYTAPAFLISTKTGQGLSVGQMIRIVKSVRAASGIRFSIHSLRHSFVTLLLQSGVPIHIAKELAGHTSIQTTAGYLQVWDEEKRTHIQRLRLPN